MIGTMSDEAKINLLSAQINSDPMIYAAMGLSTLPTEPTHASTAADYAAAELAVPGYVRQAVFDWGLGFFMDDFHVRCISAPITFHNGDVLPTPMIYSWFMVDSSRNQLIMAGLFDYPFVIEAGDNYTNVVHWQLTGEH